MIKLRPRPRGPLVIELEGPCEVYRPDGSLIPLDEPSRLLICRCGHSATPPLCDGSHYRTNFERPPADDSDPDAG